MREAVSDGGGIGIEHGLHGHFGELLVALELHEFAKIQAAVAARADKGDVERAVAHHCARALDAQRAAGQLLRFPFGKKRAVAGIGGIVGREVKRQGSVARGYFRNGAEVTLAVHRDGRGIDGGMGVRISAVGRVANGCALHGRG